MSAQFKVSTLIISYSIAMILQLCLTSKTAHKLNCTSYQYPEFYSFPPFFTIQPVLETREKQMGLWRELILSYHTSLKIKTLVVHDCPLWKNKSISRELDRDAIKSVMDDFVKRWEGSRFKIFEDLRGSCFGCPRYLKNMRGMILTN